MAKNTFWEDIWKNYMNFLEKLCSTENMGTGQGNCMIISKLRATAGPQILRWASVLLWVILISNFPDILYPINPTECPLTYSTQVMTQQLNH